MKYYMLVLFSMTIVLASCGDSIEESSETDSKEEYSYSFSLNGCETGKQKFSSKSALCKGLQNHNRNNGCAESMRKRHFENKNCSGTFNVFFE